MKNEIKKTKRKFVSPRHLNRQDTNVESGGQRFKSLVLSKVFQEEYKSVSRLFVKNKNEQEVKNRFYDFAKKHNLPLRYFDYFYDAITTFGKNQSHTFDWRTFPAIDANAIHNCEIKTKKDKNGKLEKLFIEIYPETSIEDLNSAWEVVRELKKDLPGYSDRFKKSDNYERDLKVYLLREYDNLSYDEIAKELTDEFGCIPAYTTLMTIVRNFKRKIPGK